MFHKYCLLIFLFISPFVVHADEQESVSIATVEGLPSSIVNQSVCAITGDYIDYAVDLSILGPETLVIARTYCSHPKNICRSFGQGWGANQRDFVFFSKRSTKEDSYWCFDIIESSGGGLKYEKPYDYKTFHERAVVLDLHSTKGLTNGASGEISGRTNLKNQKVVYDDHNKKIFCTSGSGALRVFSTVKHKPKEFYLQNCEIKPNGSLYQYNFDEKKECGHFKNIYCLNSGTKKEYSHIELATRDFSDHHHKFTDTYITSDNRSIHYNYENLDKDNWYLTKVECDHKPTEHYHYGKRTANGGHFLVNKVLPDNRYQHIEYYGLKTNLLGEYHSHINISSKDDYRVNRVRSISAPVGPGKEPITTHTFIYDIKTEKDSYGNTKCLDGVTHVFDAFNHLTNYHFNKQHRLTCITQHTGSKNDRHHVYSREKSVWGNEKSKDEGNLIAKYLEDAEGNIYYYRHYTYDNAGNILSSKLYGRLTGKTSPHLAVNEQGHLLPGDYECEIKTCTYSDDGLNLLKSESCHGITTKYDYLTGTNLLCSKLVEYDGRIQLREFYDYDEDRMIKEKIVDDGDSSDKNDFHKVNQRFVTTYTRRSKAPVGLLEEQSEYYVDDFKTPKPCLIKRSVFSKYTDQGLLEKEDVYDSNNDYCYSKEWAYDAHGNVVKEINPLKETITKTYDKNDNLKSKVGPHSDLIVHYDYDCMNRLTIQTEPHGTTRYTYNYLNQCESSFDSYGNETKFEYDDFGRVIATYLPEVVDENGLPASPMTKKEYDIAGLPIKLIDAAGGETFIEYNYRGKPTRIIYPDQSEETFVYYLNGELAIKTEKNKTMTQYTYDKQGRKRTETIKGPKGAVLSTQEWKYNAFNLVSYTDPVGQKTTYEYDRAGRLIAMKRGNQTQEYSYDTLGRQNEIKEWCGEGPNDYRLFCKTYDFLDRVVEEQAKSPDGTILYYSKYQYDCQGNQELIVNGKSETFTKYDFQGNPVEIKNAMGDITRTVYKKDKKESETTDPLGNITVHIFDAANRLVEIAKKNSLGIQTFSQKIYYDLLGNKRRVVDNVMVDDKILRSVETLFFYTKDNQLETLIEAAGTPNQKVTHHRYNTLGQKSSTIKPDGTIIEYRYDKKGRLETLSSKDIHYSYRYDENDQVVRVKDKTHQLHTECVYNALGELISEKLGHGHTLNYDYDRAGQLKKITLPDRTAFEYVYNPVNLTEIHRIKDNQRVYSHYDQTHDLVGHTTAALLPGKNGKIHYSYDPMDRFNSISHPTLNQVVPTGGYDGGGNLLHYQSQGKEHRFTYDHLYQLTSEIAHQQHTYKSDSLSNRLEKDGLQHTVNELNQLVKRGEETYSYDPNGNLKEKRKGDSLTQYDYDALDRLITVTKDGKKFQYKYDAFNRRLIKTLPDGPDQHFIYAAQEEMGLMENGIIKQLKMVSKGKRSPAVALELNDQVYVPFYDLFGHLIAVSNLDGETVERYAYTAFGEAEVYDPEGHLLQESAIGNPWGYANRRYDVETGFVAFGVRYYDPDLGRWLTPDPVGFDDGPNLYAYVHNNPLVLYDQYGLFADFEFAPFSTLYNFSNYFFYDMAKASTIFKEYSWADRGGDLQQDPVRYYGASGRYSIDEMDYGDGVSLQLEGPRGTGVGFTNGIMNSFRDFDKSLSYLVKMTGNPITGVFDRTQGLLRDLKHHGDAFMGGISYTPVSDLHQQWNLFFAKNPQDAIFLQICHSRGATNVRNALMSYPEELRKRIRVIAVSPAAFIDPAICESVVHLVSWRDYVQLGDMYNMVKFRETVVFLAPARGASFHDHGFRSKTYEKELFRHIQIYYRDSQAISEGRKK